jgi:diguanylate cyclase (GGDEF)-like protein
MTNPPDDFFKELQREYLAEAPARLSELRKDLAALRAGEPDAAASLKSRFHRLAGSGGSYGFGAISAASREAEHRLADTAPIDDAGFAFLAAAVGRIAAAIDAGGRELGLSQTQHPAPFGWRAALVGGASYLANRLSGALRDAQYVVTMLPLDTDPAEIAASEWPELVVVLPGPDEDPREAVTRWIAGRSGRRVAVALAAELPEADLIAAPWAGLDLLVTPGQADGEVPVWARAIARAGASPNSLLIVDSNPEEQATLRGWLESPLLRVTPAATAAEALHTVRQEAPHAILLDLDLPDADGLGLARLFRREARLAFTPILAIARTGDDLEHARALEAGIDEVFVRPLRRDRVVAAAQHRAARARRLDEVVRRDPLTGYLTTGALRDEMESVLAFARREGEQLTFALFDIDHLRRINEQLGYQAGDLVLAETARLIRERVRACDLLVRMGGEEFGVLLRACGPHDGFLIAEQVRVALEGHPPMVQGSAQPVRLSAGVAGYPDHAVGLRELLAAAERALREAKETGRDRVVVAR